MQRLPSRFHENALRALGVAYETDGNVLSALRARASEFGVRFPASFIEWYSMRNGITLLRQHSNSDEPLEIAKLGAPTWTFKDRSVPESMHGRMLQFMVENQGVCTWGIALDAGDDPPVLVAVDPDFEWRPHAASFSTFIECQVWDHGKVHSGLRLAAQASELAPLDLELLRRRFREKTTTHGWPTKNIFRALSAWIKALPASEKDNVLMRVLADGPHVAVEFRDRFSAEHRAALRGTPRTSRRRTVRDLVSGRG